MSQDRKIVMVGLDAAGKTTVLYQLKLQEVLMTIPTIGAEMGFLLKMTHVYIVFFEHRKAGHIKNSMGLVGSYRWFRTGRGFNVETVEYRNIRFTVWDIGGVDGEILSGSWRLHFKATYEGANHPKTLE